MIKSMKSSVNYLRNDLCMNNELQMKKTNKQTDTRKEMRSFIIIVKFYIDYLQFIQFFTALFFPLSI